MNKIFYGIMAFVGINIVFLLIGCAYGAPLMGIVLGWGVLALGFMVLYPLIKLAD